MFVFVPFEGEVDVRSTNSCPGELTPKAKENTRTQKGPQMNSEVEVDSEEVEGHEEGSGLGVWGLGLAAG